MKNILIIRLSALGDILHMLWIIPQLRNDFKDAKISLLIDERFVGLFKDSKLFDEYLIVRKKHFLSDLMRIKKQHKFDCALDFQSRLKSAFAARLLAKLSYGYAANGCKNPLASLFYTKHCKCLYSANVYERSKQLYLRFSKDYLNATSDEFIKITNVFTPQIKRGFILLHNGASKLDKTLKIEQLKELIDLLKDEQIIFSWGNEIELARAKELAGNEAKCINDLKELDLSGSSFKRVILPKISLDKLAQISAQAGFIIGHDSGPLHLGTMSGAKTLCFIKEYAHKPPQRFMAPSKNAFYIKFNDFNAAYAANLIKKSLYE